MTEKAESTRDETFEIRDPEINAEEIMERIRTGIREKKEAGVYTDEMLQEVERLRLPSLAEKRDYFEHYLRTAHALWQIEVDRYKLGIPPKLNHPGLAHLVIWSKKIVRRILRFHTRAVQYSQNEFNGHMVNVMDGLYQRLRELEAQVSDLTGEVRKLSGEGEKEKKH